jgi:acetoin utilization protein AcuB
MLVRERMTPNPVTITTDVSVPDALRLMHERRVRRLPVLDGRGRLVGIVSEKDLLNAAPSPATSLSIWEIHYLLARLKVQSVMTTEVLTVSEDAPIEDAARIMIDRKIGGLPVMRDATLVGIITETDLFKAFLALLGGRRQGVRITAYTPGVKGTVSKITGAVFGVGGDIVGLGFSEIPDTAEMKWEMTIKVQGVPRDTLVAALRPVVKEILDVRET